MRLSVVLVSTLFGAFVHGQSNSSTGTITSATGAVSTSTPSAPLTTLPPVAAQAVTLQVPDLIQCRFVTFAFDHAPVSSKIVSIFVDGATAFLEQFTLDSSYDPLEKGTFAWRVDLPVGLPVHIQLNVVRTNADGSHSPESATSPAQVVKSGTDSSCLAQNVGQNTKSILSYASSLDPAFRWSGAQASPTSSAANGSASDGPNVGVIAGAVVAGVVAICLVAVIFFWLRHRSRKQRMMLESQSIFGGMSEKTGPGPYAGSMFGYAHAAGQGSPHHAAPVPFDEYGRPLDTVQYSHDGFPLVPGQEQAPAPVNRAPVGTLPEPMDADEDARPGRTQDGPSQEQSHGLNAPRSDGPAGPFTPTSMNEVVSPVGTEGLDDPSSFSPDRQRR